MAALVRMSGRKTDAKPADPCYIAGSDIRAVNT